MIKHTINVQLSHTFGNIMRNRHVLIVCRDHQGNFLLGDKTKFYPKDTYRLIGGGIDKDEVPVNAAIREIKEELNLTITPVDIKLLLEVVTNAKVADERYSLTTYIFHLHQPIDPDRIKPGDDIEGVKALSLDQLKQLIDRYNSFTTDDWFDDSRGYHHCWQDYGKVYGPIHQLVHDHFFRLKHSVPNVPKNGVKTV